MYNCLTHGSLHFKNIVRGIQSVIVDSKGVTIYWIHFCSPFGRSTYIRKEAGVSPSLTELFHGSGALGCSIDHILKTYPWTRLISVANIPKFLETKLSTSRVL